MLNFDVRKKFYKLSKLGRGGEVIWTKSKIMHFFLQIMSLTVAKSAYFLPQKLRPRIFFDNYQVCAFQPSIFPQVCLGCKSLPKSPVRNCQFVHNVVCLRILIIIMLSYELFVCRFLLLHYYYIMLFVCRLQDSDYFVCLRSQGIQFESLMEERRYPKMKS